MYVICLQDILLFNLREEPVLFVHEEFDMVPYSPRHQDHPDQCIVNKGFRVSETARMEVDMRKEVSAVPDILLSASV